MSLMCYQASVPGTSHLALGIPNQDSFAVRIVRSGWSSTCVAPGGTRVRRVRGDEFVVAAVADGLGSAELSDLGSAAAATAAVEALSLSAATYPGLAGIDDLKLEGIVHRALTAVNRKAAEVGADPAALATTLALCVWDGYSVAWACAGDSGIVGLFADGYHPLCRMDRAGHRNTVFSLSADDHWRFGMAEGVEGLVLATDGMLEQFVPGFVVSASEADGDLANVEVNDPLLDLLLRLDPADAARPEDLSAAAEKFLGDLDPIDVYDDKTVVVLYEAPDACGCDADVAADRPASERVIEDGGPIGKQPFDEPDDDERSVGGPGGESSLEPDADSDAGPELVGAGPAEPAAEPAPESAPAAPEPEPAPEPTGPAREPEHAGPTSESAPTPAPRPSISAVIDRAVPAVEVRDGSHRAECYAQPRSLSPHALVPGPSVGLRPYRHLN